VRDTISKLDNQKPSKRRTKKVLPAHAEVARTSIGLAAKKGRPSFIAPFFSVRQPPHERARRQASYPRNNRAGWVKYHILMSPDLRHRIESLARVIFPHRSKRPMAPWVIDRLEGMVEWEEADNEGRIPSGATTIGGMLRLNAVEMLRRVGMYEEAVGLAGRLLSDPDLVGDIGERIELLRDELYNQLIGTP